MEEKETNAEVKLTANENLGTSSERGPSSHIEIEDRPLVTFALLAYNQERFIREAVEGAFSQTYSPLEIILSDDCSQDRTFEIMKEMAEAYKGPHKIILNRNERNLGIGGHINRIMEISHGELIVTAAGDDISLPDRTLEFVKKYTSEDKKPTLIFSHATVMDENGNERGRVEGSYNVRPNDFYTLLNGDCHIIGASNCWHKSVFYTFGPFVVEGLLAEDRVLTARAALLGRIVCVPISLVKYRRGSANLYNRVITTPDDLRAHLLRIANLNINTYKQHLHDFQILSGCYNYHCQEAIELIKGKIDYHTKEANLLRSDNLHKKVRCVIWAIRKKKPWRVITRWICLAFMPGYYYRRIMRNFS
ncbi:MAG: glycosyltransferase [Deltaproteobacteria bacterium]|nr:glycosyltransferase [Deltaproteobacteria bacterium]